MYGDYHSGISPLVFGSFALVGGFLLFLLVAWSLFWKAKALWRAARKGQKGWFLALLLINTAGILEIIYLYFLSEKAHSVEK